MCTTSRSPARRRTTARTRDDWFAQTLPITRTVIPGRRGAASPESMNTGLWNMDSGLAAMRRPGMTMPARYEFGPRSIDTGCQRFKPLSANTAGLTQDIGHLPDKTSDNS